MPWGQAVPDLPGHQHFQHIGNHIHAQANREDDHSFPESMDGGKCRGIDQPENEYAGVKCIDQKSLKGDPGKIRFGKCFYHQGVGRIQVYFFEEDIIDAHACKKNTPQVGDGVFECKKFGDQLREEIRKKHQHDIADPYTGNKAESAFIPVVDALLDNGEDHRTYGEHQDQTNTKTL